MLTLLINLERSVDRLGESKAQLDQLGVEYQRVSATDGLHLSDKELALYDVAKSWRRTGRELSNGEIACFLSHLRCMNLFVESSFRTCLIIEDDIDVDDEAAALLGETVDWLNDQGKNQVDLVHLSRPVRKIYRPVRLGNSILERSGLSYAPYLPMTTGAILWSRTGATAFLGSTSSIGAPIDETIQAWCAQRGRSYGFTRAPMRTRGNESLIELGRADIKKTRSVAGSIARLASRLPTYARAYVHRAKFARRAAIP